jgi:hypothetical protein
VTPHLARRLLFAAALLGLAGNWLLRAEFWRAGFLIWVLGILGVIFAASRYMLTSGNTASDQTAHRERTVLLVSAALLTLLLVLRDAEILFVLDLFAVFVVAALIAWRASGRSLSTLEPRDAAVGGIATVSTVMAGAPMLALRDAAPARLESAQRRALGGYGVGAIVAAPVLIAVAMLLGSADPLFAQLLEDAGAMLDVSLVGHVVGTLIAAWVVAGALRGSIIMTGAGTMAARMHPRLPFPIVAPLLAGLTVLLSVWIALQVRTIFGGAEYVATASGVTVADYARQGFFELIVIAGIVLAALLFTDEVLDRNAERERRTFRTFGLALLGLVSALLVSALFRLALYLRYFGLTEDRVLALAVLVWVAAVLGWFGLTVLRNARVRFAPGVLVISAIWLGALNLANPERWIVETNLSRAERGLEFDIAYHAKLSGDALPALLDGADRLGPARAAELRAAISTVWTARAVERADWRSWSIPYKLAAQRVQ